MSEDNKNVTTDENNAKSKEKDNNLTTTKLLAAAFAAITASVITAKLTSYFGSIMIVGVTSILIAIFSEIYTRVIKKTKKISAKVVSVMPYDKILPDSISDRIDRKLLDVIDTTTSTIPLIAVKDFEKTTVIQQPDNGTRCQNGTLDVTTSIMKYHDDNSSYNESLAKLVNGDKNNTDEFTNVDDNVSKSHDSSSITSEIPTVQETLIITPSNNDAGAEKKLGEEENKWNRIVRKINSIIRKLSDMWDKLMLNTITKGILLFFAIALTATVVSWASSSIFTPPMSVTVKEQKVQKLSDNEKQIIKEQVKNEVNNQILKAQNDAANANVNAVEMKKKLESLEKSLSDMKDEIDRLKNNQDNVKTQPNIQQPSNNNNHHVGTAPAPQNPQTVNNGNNTGSTQPDSGKIKQPSTSDNSQNKTKE